MACAPDDVWSLTTTSSAGSPACTAAENPSGISRPAAARPSAIHGSNSAALLGTTRTASEPSQRRHELLRLRAAVGVVEASGETVAAAAEHEPKKVVKAIGMTMMKIAESRSRRVSSRSLRASVQIRFTPPSLSVALGAHAYRLLKRPHGDHEEDDGEGERHQQVAGDVGEVAAAHRRVPAAQQRAVRGEPLDRRVGAGGRRRAGEVAAQQGEDEVDAGADRARLPRRACTTAMTSRARPLATAASTTVSTATTSRPPPVDAEEQAPGDEQHDGLHGDGEEDGGELAAEDRARGRRRRQHAREGAVLVFGDDRARHVGGAEEHEEDHHAGEDQTDGAPRPRPRSPAGDERRAVSEHERRGNAAILHEAGGRGLRGGIVAGGTAGDRRRDRRGRPRPVEVEQRLA